MYIYLSIHQSLTSPTYPFVSLSVSLSSYLTIYILDLSEFDKNLDGFVDESELEDIFTTREARQVLEMADQDGELWQLKF